MKKTCPDNIMPDGPVCPRCGKARGPSGIDGGSWVHIQNTSDQQEKENQMSKARYSNETVYQVWNDDTGDYIEVGPDRDGLDLVEIRQYDNQGRIGDRLTFHPEEAKRVAEALSLAAVIMNARTKQKDEQGNKDGDDSC